MRTLSLLLLLYGLVACSSLQQPVNSKTQVVLSLPAPLYLPGEQIPTPDQIFALPEEAKQLLDRKFKHYSDDPQSRLYAFKRWMTRRDGYRVLYDNSMSYTAAETFTLGAGNCMSLAILTYSFARYLDFWPEFMEPDVPLFWEQREGIEIINGHINVVVRPLQGSWQGFFVDFDPRSAYGYTDNKRLSRDKTIALFYHNRAAEHLALGERELAYSYAHQVLQLLPQEASSYSILGVILRRQGLVSLAEKVYLRGLHLDPHHPFLLNNLVYLYRSSEQEEKAAPYLAVLERQRIQSPFLYARQAEEHYQNGELEAALDLYNRAIRKADYVHDFYFGKAQVLLAMGNYKEAERALRKAKEYSLTLKQGESYQNKLTALASLN